MSQTEDGLNARRRPDRLKVRFALRPRAAGDRVDRVCMQTALWILGALFAVIGAVLALLSENSNTVIAGCLLLLTGVTAVGFGVVVEAVRRAFPAADMSIRFGDATARGAAKVRAAAKSGKVYVPPEPDLDRPRPPETASAAAGAARKSVPEMPSKKSPVHAAGGEAPAKSKKTLLPPPPESQSVKKPAPPPPESQSIKKPAPPPPALLELQQATAAQTSTPSKKFVPPDH
jgi:hypothetical protein